MKKNKLISHLYKNDIDGLWTFQSNDDHTIGVAKLASQYASKFGMASWAKAIGTLHDKGKEASTFQQHIMKESGYEPNLKVVGNPHHAYVGGVIARELYGKSFDNFILKVYNKYMK